MRELLAVYASLSLADQFRTGTVLLVAVFVILLGVVFCGPMLVRGARDLFPDETLEDDEHRLVQARRRRLELK